MNALLLAVSVLMNLLSCGILRNDFCKNEIKSSADLYSFNAINSLISAATLAVIALFGGSLCAPSLFTTLLALAFGLATALCAIMIMFALESGPLSYTNVIVSCAMVIPALSGVAFFGESVSAVQYAGTVLMVLSFVFAVDRRSGNSAMNLKWLLLCLGSFLFSGSVGVMQKIHQSSAYKDELGIFLVIAFMASAVFSAALAAYYRRRGQEISFARRKRVGKLVVVSLVSGVGFALCNQINMYLAGIMDAIIFYPIINGGSLILTTSAGLLIWKERLTRKQWAGLLLGAAAIFLLCGIF